MKVMELETWLTERDMYFEFLKLYGCNKLTFGIASNGETILRCLEIPCILCIFYSADTCRLSQLVGDNSRYTHNCYTKRFDILLSEAEQNNPEEFI